MTEGAFGPNQAMTTKFGLYTFNRSIINKYIKRDIMLMQSVLILLHYIMHIHELVTYNLICVSSESWSTITAYDIVRTLYTSHSYLRHAHCRATSPPTFTLPPSALRSLHGASPQRRFIRLGVPRMSLRPSRRSSHGAHLLGTTHGASSVSASNVSRPELKPSPAAAQVLT